MARKICNTTGKQNFPSELEAELAIASIAATNAQHRHRKFREEPARAYPCPHGDHWHFTSQS